MRSSRRSRRADVPVLAAFAGRAQSLVLVASLTAAGTAAAGDASAPQAARAAAPSGSLDEVLVIGTAPLPGSGIDIDKVPSNVQTVSAATLQRDGGAATLVEAAARRLSSVTQNQEQGSIFQPDFVFRGFEASPIAGIAQGIAVYQNGTRINEAFGDTVNWDLVPQFAVERMTIQSNSPVFGLNALGGAVTLEMKTAFDDHAAEAEFQGGSYGNQSGHAELGHRSGDFGVYLAAGATQDGGFRYHGRTTLRQAYGDAGYESGSLRLHASVSVADDDIGAAGSTPVQLLAQNPRAVFTTPQSMHNRVQMVQIAATESPGEAWQLSANLYFRHFLQDLVDGNTTDVQACANNAAYFCLEGTDTYPGDALYAATGSQVPVSVLPPGVTPGETDDTRTASDTLGSTWQATWTRPAFGRSNHLVAGASVDRSVTAYGAHGELGTLTPDLSVLGSGVVIDQSFSTTAQAPLEEPVALRSVGTDYGAYFTDTLDVSERVAWTFSARLNTALISLRDRIGTNLDGDHRYSRLNPGTGITYRRSAALTMYAGYSQSNRAPTAGELSCANPALPCLLDTFLLSDPPLHQVVAQTSEAGLRGALAAAGSSAEWRWNLGLFRTDNRDDILRLPTRINGFGYFSNVGGTRRQGVEFGLDWRQDHWDASLSYSRIDATFRDALALSSNSPAADANGEIQVRPGDHLPLTPVDRLSLQAEYAVRRRWAVGADARYAGPEYLVGDESNQEPRLPATVVFDLHATRDLGARLRLFAKIENLFDRNNDAYGAFTDLGGLPPNFRLTDARAFSPSPGRTFYLGMHLDL